MHAKAFTIMNFIMQRTIFFIVLMTLWYTCYPQILQSIEENAFWIDAPDMYNVLYNLPSDWAAIASHYLAQFFIERFFGACIMALLPLIVLLSADVMIWQLFRNRRLQCLAFIPGVATALLFMHNGMLTQSIQAAVIAAILAIVVLLCTIRHPLHKVTYFSRWYLVTTNVTPYILIAVMAIAIKTDKQLQGREYTATIEHLAADRNWDKLLEMTYPQRNSLDDNLTAYSLLALSQKGQLAEKLFHYRVKGLDNIFMHSKNYRFNSFFCHELGLPNEAIRYAFEEGQYMPAGASLGTIRRMVDWLIEKGDDPELVDYYLNILDHTSCHSRYVNARRVYLAQQTPKPKEQKPEFVGSPSFIYEAALVSERDPLNTRSRDYLLCAMLLLGNNEAFYDLFQHTYVQMDDEQIPTHYYEALLVLRQYHPNIDQSYNIPLKIEQDYRNFCELRSHGDNGRKMALSRYPDTYWAYRLRKKMLNDHDGITYEKASVIGVEFGN